MASITYWSRLEPRPRTPSIARSLAAQVRDPLWMLTRQWQLGESRGEDAGSPAFAQLAARLGRLRSWSANGSDARPLPEGVPLEALALGEDFSQTDVDLPTGRAQVTDVSLAVELGQVFEQALVSLGRADLISKFRDAYPVAQQEDHVDSRDDYALFFLQVAAGRATNGAKLFQVAEKALPNLPAEPAIATGDQTVVRDALMELRTWVVRTVGRIGQSDALSWNPERLEYDLQVAGPDSSGRGVTLPLFPDRDGRCEWYAFDLQERSLPDAEIEENVARVHISIIPANVNFRGMANARWWTFESGAMNLSAVRPEKRELAKLIVLDFMLVHSNDWYVMPFRQPLGTLCRVESLVVHDVFGGLTLIERADHRPAPPDRKWTMFSTSIADTGEIADFFLLPSTAGRSVLSSEALEEVRFVRDEMANIAWAIERTVESGIGEPWPAHERSLTGLESEEAAGTPSEASAALLYQIQTSVPEHWFPFLPVVITPFRRDIQFERGVILRPDDTKPPEPSGRILRPTRSGEQRYHLREEELPRPGLRLARIVNRSRWIDGSTHVWIARRKTFEGREERSGLLFDVAFDGFGAK